MIKVVFVDVDDTLLNSRREITEYTKSVVEQCIKNNIKIILASGRSRVDTLKYQIEAGASPYIISSNGADIYDIEKKKTIRSYPISKKIIKKLLNYAEGQGYKITFNYEFSLVMNKCFFLDEEDKKRTIKQLEEIIENEEIVQCVISDIDYENMKKCREYLYKEMIDLRIINESKRLKNPLLKPSKSYYCDIVNNDVSKGTAIDILCKYLNVKEDEIAVIGDGTNDISMFEKTNNSVAMENSIEAVKEKANYITKSNDEDGVAKYLEDIIKNFRY